MKRKITGTAIFLVAAVLSLSAQKIQQVHIGHKIPDIRYNEVMNYKEASVTLSEFKNKAIILNLWNTTCNNATKAMLAMDSIQNAYPEDLQVLNVSRESEEKVKQYISSHTLIRHIRLPNAVGDTLTRKYFPHWIEPLFIYIDKDGIVKAISSYHHYKPENVTRLLVGKELSLPDDTDDTPANIKNAVDPLIFNDYPNRKKNIFEYTYVSAYQDNVSSRNGEYKNSDGTIRIFATNLNLSYIYAMAYLGLAFMTDTVFYPAVTINRKDSKAYITNTKDPDSLSVFCFELVSRDSTVEVARKKVQNLLDGSLGLKSSLAREKVTCWVFREIKNSTVQKDLTSKQKGDIYIKDDVFYCNNAPVIGLIPSINLNMRTPVPIYNEVGSRRKLTFTMPLKYNDREAMNNTLNQWGLELVEDVREVPVITLEDR